GGRIARTGRIVAAVVRGRFILARNRRSWAASGGRDGAPGEVIPGQRSEPGRRGAGAPGPARDSRLRPIGRARLRRSLFIHHRGASGQRDALGHDRRVHRLGAEGERDHPRTNLGPDTNALVNAIFFDSAPPATIASTSTTTDLYYSAQGQV